MRDLVDTKKIEAARAFVRQWMAALAGYIEIVVEDGGDDPDYEVRWSALEWLSRLQDGAQVERPPQQVIDLLQGLVWEHRSLKHGRRANRVRDRCIVRVVGHLVEHGFNATRNETSRWPSACSIVAEALAENGLDISESAVVAIWSRRHDLLSQVLNK
jgi:hypothetical protein